ncbi:hypothetical protein P175DRAFT_0498219 [Aspergillus ochraceoroseus IBT 24754]|uniref:Protein-lysine N-methyltransferase EFM4 n=1 Tax=Aspergillus ochraceoroseus IBT 24754 TaxID=1392256 RepID=A0A2T5M9C5_9EURO|nr:uncharacterized protein P175DRAFT_0498219 [Aspergillus ochraceoroseus IBT 24754]PTU25115.1 hypothetical protein P175DRAFT_0498219 [Aspergillus ochraceoroseus IBT 24754]
MADPTDDSHPTHLEPSQLGTKEYWETFYARTLTHLSTKQQQQQQPATTRPRGPNRPRDDGPDHGSEDDDDDDDDPGTSWFSEHNAPEKVLEFLSSHEFPLAPCHTFPPRGRAAEDKKTTAGLADDAEQRRSQPSVLDLGTGNGSMLALLRRRGGFRGRMVGVDYSGRSVQLARELQKLKMHSDDDDHDDGEEIRFEEWDILGSNAELLASTGADNIDPGRQLDWFPYDQGGFDIVLDKGTFDAISLSDETVGTGAARVCERYPGIARQLVRKGGFLVVTSCNWTEEELIHWFTGGASAGDGLDTLVVWGKVEYPRFRFGGQEGQGVCTVCFQRVEK